MMILHKDRFVPIGKPTGRYLGLKKFELNNHLGNVLTVVSDRKLQDEFGTDISSNSIVDYYTGDIVSTSDYYPFGMEMPGRSFNPSSYRYGMNGQEHESEVNGSDYSAEFWMYDSRLAKRWENDPIRIEWQSPYATFNNNPVLYCDPLGLTIDYGEFGRGRVKNMVNSFIARLFSKAAREKYKQRSESTTTYVYNINSEGDNPTLAEGGFERESPTPADDGGCKVFVNYSKTINLTSALWSNIEFNTNVIDNVSLNLSTDPYREGGMGHNGHNRQYGGANGAWDFKDYINWNAKIDLGSDYSDLKILIRSKNGIVFDDIGGKNNSYTFRVQGSLTFNIYPTDKLIRDTEREQENYEGGVGVPDHLNFTLTSPLRTYSMIYFGPFQMFHTKPQLQKFNDKSIYKRRMGKRIGATYSTNSQ